MLKFFTFSLVTSGIILLSALPAAADDALDALEKQLGEDIAAAEVPSGYTFFLAQPTARGDEDIHQKMEARLQFMFKREGLIVKKTEFGEDGWEGFTYFVFATPDAAAKYNMAESDASYELKLWAGDDSEKEAEQLNNQAWRGSVTVNVTSPTTGAILAQRCVAADFMIGCLSVEPNSNVVTHLVLQEPLLRQATSDEERQRLVTARVQKEANGLLKAAETHLAESVKSASR